MIQEGNTSNISKMTELLAAHGVYALTIIFIFYQQWRAGQNLRTAGPEDHSYFRKVHTSVVTATYVLVVISTAVWIYATFIYLPSVYIRGSVSGLTEQVVAPQKDDDPPKVIETIYPESLDIDLYESKKNKDESSTEGKYDLGWVLLPRGNVHTLVFRFQHRYEKIQSAKGTLTSFLPAKNNSESRKTSPRPIEKRFTLDLRKINYSWGNPIELIYEPDAQVENIGKIYLREPDTGNRMEIPWEEVRPGTKPVANQISGFLFSLTPVAYAASRERAVFSENGDYDRQFGRILKERLESSDLETQLAAREVLVNNGPRSFKFILDSLKAHSERTSGQVLLVSNLASAVLDIEAGGATAPRDIHMALANAFFDLNDAQSSAQFFDKAGEKSDDPPELLLERGLVYYQNNEDEKSIRILNRFLEKGPPSSSQGIAHTILGTSYQRLGRDPEAVSHYRRAIQLAPELDIAYNNLAYLYAEQGQRLQEALSLVNRALALSKASEDTAQFKDTKGWILYKLGKYDQALSLIKEAAANNPDPLIREHLKVVQSASLQKPQPKR